MRKVFFWVTVFILCFFCFNITAAAADFDDQNYIDIADMISATNSSGTVVNNNLSYAYEGVFTFNLPAEYNSFGYVDILLAPISGQIPTRAELRSDQGNFPLTVSRIGTSDYVRIYGNVDRWNFNQVKLFLGNSVGGSSEVQLISFKIFRSAQSYYDSFVTLGFDGQSLVTQTPGSTAITSINASSNNLSIYTYPVYNANVFFGDWKLYDYMDVFLKVSASSIESIAVVCDDLILPAEINVYISDGDIYYPYDIEEANTGNWVGNAHLPLNNVFYISVRVDLRNLNRTQSLSPKFFISGHYCDVFGTSITVYDTNGSIESSYPNLFKFYFRSVLDSLNDGFNSLLNVFNVGGSSGSDFDNAVSTQASEFNDLNDQFNEVTKPDIDDIESSVSDYVSNSDITAATAPLGSIFNSSIFTSVIMMSLILALCSYVIYGKR